MSGWDQRHFRAVTLAALAASLLAGCGIRGALDPPPEEQRSSDSTASADSGQGKPEDKAQKPHKDFFLDRLIR